MSVFHSFREVKTILLSAQSPSFLEKELHKCYQSARLLAVRSEAVRLIPLQFEHFVLHHAVPLIMEFELEHPIEPVILPAPLCQHIHEICEASEHAPSVICIISWCQTVGSVLFGIFHATNKLVSLSKTIRSLLPICLASLTVFYTITRHATFKSRARLQRIVKKFYDNRYEGENRVFYHRLHHFTNRHVLASLGMPLEYSATYFKAFHRIERLENIFVLRDFLWVAIICGEIPYFIVQDVNYFFPVFLFVCFGFCCFPQFRCDLYSSEDSLDSSADICGALALWCVTICCYPVAVLCFLCLTPFISGMVLSSLSGAYFLLVYSCAVGGIGCCVVGMRLRDDVTSARIAFGHVWVGVLFLIVGLCFFPGAVVFEVVAIHFVTDHAASRILLFLAALLRVLFWLFGLVGLMYYLFDMIADSKAETSPARFCRSYLLGCWTHSGKQFE